MGDEIKSSVDGNKSRLPPKVSCQQEDPDSGLIKDKSIWEQALDREH